MIKWHKRRFDNELDRRLRRGLQTAAVHLTNQIKINLSKEGGFGLNQGQVRQLRSVRRRKGLPALRSGQ